MASDSDIVTSTSAATSKTLSTQSLVSPDGPAPSTTEASLKGPFIFNSTASVSTLFHQSHSANSSGNNSLETNSCWFKWSSFWSLNDSVNAIQTTYIGGTSTFTLTETDLLTWSSEPDYTTTWSSLTTFTVTRSANGFTYTTQTSTYSTLETETVINTIRDSTETDIYTITSTEWPQYTLITPHATLQTPRCALPTYVSQCQEEWEAYESNLISLANLEVQLPSCTDIFSGSCGSSFDAWQSTQDSLLSKSSQTPSCSQASLASSFCTSLRDVYITSWLEENQGGAYWEGQLDSVGYTGSYSTFANGSSTVVSFFPTASSLAPGCTLGCARCAITGGTVRLIYWPATKTDRSDGNELFTASALGTVFTSPTVYISYESLYASDSCSGVGSTHKATILPIANSLDLSSVWEDYPDFMNPQTAFLNYTDLNAPVAQSVYDRQPQCAVWSGNFALHHQGDTRADLNFTCPRTAPYAPICKFSSLLHQCCP